MSPNEVAIRQSIARLADTFQPWPARRTEAFVRVLGDLWPEDVEAGVLTALRDWTYTKSPAPGYVRERALAHRSGRSAPKASPSRSPVGWDEARTPLSADERGYLHDAEGRYVMLPAKPYPPLLRPDVPTFLPEDWDG